MERIKWLVWSAATKADLDDSMRMVHRLPFKNFFDVVAMLHCSALFCLGTSVWFQWRSGNSKAGGLKPVREPGIRALGERFETGTFRIVPSVIFSSDCNFNLKLQKLAHWSFADSLQERPPRLLPICLFLLCQAILRISTILVTHPYWCWGWGGRCPYMREELNNNTHPSLPLLPSTSSTLNCTNTGVCLTEYDAAAA